MLEKIDRSTYLVAISQVGNSVRSQEKSFRVLNYKSSFIAQVFNNNGVSFLTDLPNNLK